MILPRATGSRGPLLYLGAALAYAAIAIAWTFPLIVSPGTHVAFPKSGNIFASNDQGAAISGGARNAAALLDGDPARLIHQQICYPTPMSATFGEHIIELGILALPVYWASRNPVLAYNSACLFMLLIAGVSTLALIRHWTGSAVGGFLAGLLFAFHPSRLENLVHPYVMGIHWLPLVLLLFERVLREARIRDGLCLALAAALQCLVGSYPLLILASFGLPFGLVRILQQRHALDRRRLLLLSLAVLLASGVAAAVLIPYQVASDVWAVLQRRNLILVPYGSLLPGQPYAAGGIAFLLAALPIAFRSRPSSPVTAVVLATISCVLLAGYGPLWPTGPALPGPYEWLADRVGLLASVRVPATIRAGAYFGLAVLGGIGVDRALRRLGRGPLLEALVGLAASGLVLVEVFQPAVSRAIFASSPAVELRERAPQAEALEAYTVFDTGEHTGPILDLPYYWDAGIVFHMSIYTLMAAYHGRPTAACFNSHLPPSYFSVARMASRLPKPRAVLELAASGFRNIVYHGLLNPAWTRLWGAEILYQSPGFTSIRLTARVRTHSDTRKLRFVAAHPRRQKFQGWLRNYLDVEIRNDAGSTWVLPKPIRPLEARVRCWSGEKPGPWHDARFMLPLALARRRSDLVPLDLGDVPADPRVCGLEAEIPELGWTISPTDVSETKLERLPGAMYPIR